MDNTERVENIDELIELQKNSIESFDNLINSFCVVGSVPQNVLDSYKLLHQTLEKTQTMRKIENGDKKENLKDLYQAQLSKVANAYKKSNDAIDDTFIERLSYPKSETMFNFHVNFGDRREMFKGYRIQHCNLLGPYKGGLRFHQDVHLDECKALAFWMTIKCALLKLPLGGGKGGVKFNPKKYNDNELKEISKSFSFCLTKIIGTNRDIPAPDVGTNSKIMDWMTAEQKRIGKVMGRAHDNGMFTGKSLNYGGSQGRTEATGRGVGLVTKQWFLENGVTDFSDKTYIIQGFGNVGTHTCEYLDKEGFTCIAIGDHTGYLHKSDGFDIPSIMEHNRKNRCIKGFPDCETMTKEDFFRLKTNVVIPAALELQIDEHIAESLRCELVVEAANGPLNLKADEVLKKKGIDVIPDVLANSGGVFVSYQEWLQNKSQEYLSLKTIRGKLDEIMIDTFIKVYNESKETNHEMRTVSYKLSIKQLENHWRINCC